MHANVNIEKILKESKLTSSFLVFGGIGLLLSVYVNNELGIKIFLLTFIFGGIFRLLNTLKKIFLIDQLKKFEPFLRFMYFLIWITVLITFAYFVNKHITIFNF